MICDFREIISRKIYSWNWNVNFGKLIPKTKNYVCNLVWLECNRSPILNGSKVREIPAKFLETNLASRWEGVRLPRASGKSPDFLGSSPATSLEVLSLWNWGQKRLLQAGSSLRVLCREKPPGPSPKLLGFGWSSEIIMNYVFVTDNQLRNS